MCNLIRNFIRLLFFRAILFPLILLGSPIAFILAEGNCKEAKQELIRLLCFVWNGFD